MRFRKSWFRKQRFRNKAFLIEGANDRPPMLEKGNYIPWESRFRRFLDNKLENKEQMWRSIQKGPYFAAKEGKSLESVYERLTKLVNIIDRNNFRPISVPINTKFLNCLQPEWNKYATMASKSKRAARNHDLLALIAHSNASSQSHASPSYSNSSQPYYVIHPLSVVDYEEDYQGELHEDSQEDKLTTAMMLLA
nr:Gag-Pol polyprotein [Tanacetum cinerariifolium]